MSRRRLAVCGSSPGSLLALMPRSDSRALSLSRESRIVLLGKSKFLSSLEFGTFLRNSSHPLTERAGWHASCIHPLQISLRCVYPRSGGFHSSRSSAQQDCEKCPGTDTVEHNKHCFGSRRRDSVRFGASACTAPRAGCGRGFSLATLYPDR